MPKSKKPIPSYVPDKLTLKSNDEELSCALEEIHKYLEEERSKKPTALAGEAKSEWERKDAYMEELYSQLRNAGKLDNRVDWADFKKQSGLPVPVDIELVGECEVLPAQVSRGSYRRIKDISNEEIALKYAASDGVKRHTAERLGISRQSLDKALAERPALVAKLRTYNDDVVETARACLLSNIKKHDCPRSAAILLNTFYKPPKEEDTTIAKVDTAPVKSDTRDSVMDMIRLKNEEVKAVEDQVAARQAELENEQGDEDF